LGLKDYLVHVTPSPILAWFQRFHERVLAGVKMFGRMLVFRRIAATDVATTQAQAQVDPGVAHLQAFFAPMGVRFYVMDLIEVGTTAHASYLKT
jgi:hypothetical protein